MSRQGQRDMSLNLCPVKVNIMSQIINASPADLGALVKARRAVVKVARSTGEVIQGYADVLCATFNVQELATGRTLTPWYELKGKDARAVKDERAAFVADMTDAGYGKGTIDVYWQRIKEASGYVTAGNRVKGATDTDGKTLAELKTIINRIFKAEEAGEECKASDHKRALMDVYEALGGEVDKLG